MNSKNLIITIILIVIFAGIGFYAGMKYQQNRVGGAISGRGGYGSRFGANRFGNSNGMQAIRGQIVSADSSSITIKLADGSSKIVILPSSINILKTATANISDLKSGITVMVFGTTNTDGSVTASSVQLNPLERSKLGVPNNSTPSGTNQ